MHDLAWKDYMNIREKCFLDQIGSVKHAMLLMFEGFILFEDEILEWINWPYDFS